MRRARRGLFLTAAGVVAMSLSAPPALAAPGEDQSRGATVEEFVCFRDTGNQTRIGTGKVITTPSGNEQVVCTGQPL